MCPGPVVADCATWLDELEQATPSLVFEITVDGQAVSEAKVFVDDAAVTDWSHAVKVDPGSHVVRVEVASHAPHEEKVVMAEGHRMRLVSIGFASAKPAPSPEADTAPSIPLPPAAPARPVPVVVYPLLGLGVAGLAAFGVFDGLGRAKQTNLEQTCAAQGCSSAALSPMRTEYLVGDISLGVGAAALIGAAVVYLTRSSEKPRTASLVRLDLGPSGGLARRNQSWAASATLLW